MKSLNFGYDLGLRFKFAKTFVLGLLIGAFLTALMLDKRYLAIMKAFQNPQAVNGLTFSVEVSKK